MDHVAPGWKELLAQRPFVFVEDHLSHVDEFISLARGAALAGDVAVVCLDRPGPDTTRSIARWLEPADGLIVAALASPEDIPSPDFVPLATDVWSSPAALQRAVAVRLRAGGRLLQDVHLAPLTFVDADRWWESIAIAAGVRGSFPRHPPRCVFLSNKRGYQATFGHELLQAGFDPRDVFPKDEMSRFLVAWMREQLGEAFPWRMDVRDGSDLRDVRLGKADDLRAEWDRHLDVVWGPERDGCGWLSGRLVAKGRVRIDVTRDEAATWRALAKAHVAGEAGPRVLDIGARVAPRGAGPAEATNLAAKHLYALRRRLVESEALVTRDHRYALRSSLRVGLVRALRSD